MHPFLERHYDYLNSVHFIALFSTLIRTLNVVFSISERNYKELEQVTDNRPVG